MKKLLVIAFTLVAAVTGWAQGTLTFANGGVGVNAPVTYLGSNVSGAAYVADLYWGAQGTAAGSLTALGANVGFGSGGSAGYFFGGSRTLPTTGTVTVQVRAWRVADGATYEQAVANGGVYGGSNLIDVTLASGATTPPNLIGLQSFALVPEPSTFALGALGIGALLMVRRRKV